MVMSSCPPRARSSSWKRPTKVQAKPRWNWRPLARWTAAISLGFILSVLGAVASCYVFGPKTAEAART